MKLNPWRIVLASVLTSGVLLVSQTNIGPMVGLRIPIYDNLLAGKPNPYRYLKLNPDQFQIDPDPGGLSDGFFSVRKPVPVSTLSVGAALPNATVGVPYSQSLVASGGVAPYVWAVTAGALAPGLSLSSTGILSGTPTSSGTFTVTVTVTDSAGSAIGATFTSVPTPVLTTYNYVGGPTGAIVVRNDKVPPEIDVDTSMVPRKAQSETIAGKWTFVQP